MKRITAAAALVMLALPASAAAAGSSGVVLSVHSRHHMIEVVDTDHVVHGYRYRGQLPQLHTGSPIAFRRSGRTISRVKVSAVPAHRSRSVSYFARVVRSSHHGLVLALADGQRMRFSAGQIGHQHMSTKHHSRMAHMAVGARAAGKVTVNILGLQPGATVLVTETLDGYGDITITISLPRSSAPGSPAQGSPAAGSPGSPEQDATGVVTAVSAGSITLTDDATNQPDTITADASDSMFDGVAVGDQVDVSYHESASQLVADQVDDSGTPG